MAKGNMLQGMARGKVGDVVFSRKNGQQISRAYNPHHLNPRTNAQLYQRSVWATILRAYSAGKEIFDHSFEGCRKGAECQQRFMKLNADKLRKALVSDVRTDDQTNAQLGRFVPPECTYPVPWSYQISEGSLPSILDHVGRVPQLEQNETVAHFCERVGFIPGDIFTVCFINAEVPTEDNVIFEVQGSNSDLAKYTAAVFGYVRITVRSDVYENNDVAARYSQIFALTKTVNVNEDALLWQNKSLTAVVGVIPQLALPYYPTVLGQSTRAYFGTIHSRTNEGLRSTAIMANNVYPAPVAPGIEVSPSLDYGQASNYVLEAWKQGTVSIPSTDLILEGG